MSKFPYQIIAATMNALLVICQDERIDALMRVIAGKLILHYCLLFSDEEIDDGPTTDK